jgi:catenin alpha
VEEMAAIFTEHANKLVEVANLACSMSNNDDGVKMVRYAASQIENLCPQVKHRLHKRRQLWLR